MDKPIRVVVRMFGGTIDSVCTDDAGTSLDVVFTEDMKYATEEETLVKSGMDKGRFIYTQQESTVIDKKDMDAVFKAAEKRING